MVSAWLLALAASSPADNVLLQFTSFVPVGDGIGVNQGLNLARQRVWAKKYAPPGATTPLWEVAYEGAGIPGSNQLPHLNWDNPIDDDWEEAQVRATSWKVNSSEGGVNFLGVDRTIVAYELRSGHFWRRDPFVTGATGFKAEFRVRVAANSGDRGVMLHFFDDLHQFKFHFAVDRVTFHQKIGGASAVYASKARDNRVWTTYEVTKAPNTGVITMTADGENCFPSPTVLVPGPTGTIYQGLTGESGRIATRIGFGDNNNDGRTGSNYLGDHAGAYDVDYFRYSRVTPTTPRAAPALPPRQMGTEVWTNVRTAASGTVVTANTKLYTHITNVLDTANGNFGRSLEVKVKLLPNGQQQNGFSFDYWDKVGGVTLAVFPDRIEMKPTARPGVPAVAYPANFNGLSENTLRLVRAQRGLYWYVYVNGNPIPALYDICASGISESDSTARLLFGPFRVPQYSELGSATLDGPRLPTGATAEVPLIRWVNQPVSP